MCSSRCLTTWEICANIVVTELENGTQKQEERTKNRGNAKTKVLSRSSCNCSDGKRMCVALWVRVFALLFFDGKHWDMGERNMENQNCVCFCNITAQCAILHIKDQVCNWQQIKEHWEVQGVLVRNVYGRLGGVDGIWNSLMYRMNKKPIYKKAWKTYS